MSVGQLETIMSKGERKDMTIENSTPELQHDSLEYMDGVVEKLKESIEEFLEFSTTKDLIRVINDTIN